MKNKIGVYFFLKRRKIVYIGQTQDFAFRLYKHFRNGVDFDRVRFIECSADKCLVYEKRWILRFKPEYNIFYTLRKCKVLKGAKYKTRERDLDKLDVGQHLIPTTKHPHTQVCYYNKTRLNKKFKVITENSQLAILRVI